MQGLLAKHERVFLGGLVVLEVASLLPRNSAPMLVLTVVVSIYGMNAVLVIQFQVIVRPDDVVGMCWTSLGSVILTVLLHPKWPVPKVVVIGHRIVHQIRSAAHFLGHIILPYSQIVMLLSFMVIFRLVLITVAK